MYVSVAQAGEFNWNCNWSRRGKEAFNQAQPPMQQPQIIAWSMELLGIGCVCVGVVVDVGGVWEEGTHSP